MPSTDLAKILVDTGVFQAEYKPVQDSEGENAVKPADCNIPSFDLTPIVLTPITPPTILKDCIVNFVPTPIVPTPYIDVGDLTVPCAPDGFIFRSNGPGSGTITYDPDETAVIETVTVWFIQGSVAVHFIAEIQDLVDEGAPLPELEFTYLDVVYTSRVHSIINDRQLYVTSKFRDSDGNQLNTTITDTAYNIKRIVFTTDPDRPTDGNLFFIKTDEFGCEGAFVGDINFNIGTIDVPCPTVDNSAATPFVAVKNYSYPDGNEFQEQEFRYQLSSSSDPCSIHLNLTLPPGNEIIIPQLDFDDSTTVTWDTPVVSVDGKKITMKAHSSGGGSGSNCCVWQ